MLRQLRQLIKEYHAERQILSDLHARLTDSDPRAVRSALVRIPLHELHVQIARSAALSQYRILRGSRPDWRAAYLASAPKRDVAQVIVPDRPRDGQKLAKLLDVADDPQAGDLLTRYSVADCLRLHYASADHVAILDPTASDVADLFAARARVDAAIGYWRLADAAKRLRVARPKLPRKAGETIRQWHERIDRAHAAAQIDAGQRASIILGGVPADREIGQKGYVRAFADAIRAENEARAKIKQSAVVLPAECWPALARIARAVYLRDCAARQKREVVIVHGWTVRDLPAEPQARVRWRKRKERLIQMHSAALADKRAEQDRLLAIVADTAATDRNRKRAAFQIHGVQSAIVATVQALDAAIRLEWQPLRAQARLVSAPAPIGMRYDSDRRHDPILLENMRKGLPLQAGSPQRPYSGTRADPVAARKARARLAP